MQRILEILKSEADNEAGLREVARPELLYKPGEKQSVVDEALHIERAQKLQASTVRSPEWDNHSSSIPVTEARHPFLPILLIQQYTLEGLLDIPQPRPRRAREYDFRELLLQISRDRIRPVQTIFRWVVGRLVPEASGLVRSEGAQEPDGARDCDLVSVEKLEEVVSFWPVGDAFAELCEGDVGVRQIREPGLPLRLVQSHSRGHAERRRSAL